MGSISADSFEAFCSSLEETPVSLEFCERFDEKSNIWNLSRHKHTYVELLYFLYGGVEVTAQERSMEATFYDVVVYPRDTYHTENLQYSKHNEVICLWVDIGELSLPEVIHIQDNNAELKWLLEQIHREHKSSEACRYLIECYIKAALLLIARKYMHEKSPQDSINRVILYMRDHLSSEITVEEMARMIYVSKSYLSRMFKKRTGKSLMQYLRELRIQSAKTMLVSTDESIEDIAYKTGFNSPKYFCNTFRRHTGVPPRAFRLSERYSINKLQN